MATVDGITVAAADVIDKKHIASMAVVGGNLNLTRENASVLSVALPSGGGGQKWSMAAPGALFQEFHTTGVVYLNTSSLSVDYWDEYPIDSSIPPVDFNSTAGEFGWNYGEAGWYEAVLTVEAMLSPAVSSPTALPNSVVVDYQSWFGIYVQHEIPLVEKWQDLGGAKRVCRAVVPLGGPYYSAGPDETPEQSAHQLFLRWNGNATMGAINGTTNPRLVLSVVKIA